MAGTYGAITEAVNRARKEGKKVAQAHFRYLNPLPKNTEQVLRKYKKILCPELNLGQFAKIIKSEFSVDIIPFNKIQGLPFKSSEIENKIDAILGGDTNDRN